MRLVVGVLLNVMAFVLLALSQLLLAVAIYIVSLALILAARDRKEAKPVEERKEPTPEEIRRRPVSAPEI